MIMIYHDHVEGWQVARWSSGMAWIMKQRPLEWIGARLMNQMDKRFVPQIILLCCFRWLWSVFQSASCSDLRCSELTYSRLKGSKLSIFKWNRPQLPMEEVMRQRLCRSACSERWTRHIVIQNIMAHNHLIILNQQIWHNKSMPQRDSSALKVGSFTSTHGCFSNLKNKASTGHTMTIN